MSDSKLLRLSSVAAIALAPFVLAGVASAQGYTPSTAKGDWPMYFADPSGSRYSPSDQINAQNFNKLELAWHFKTDAMGSHPEYKLEGTPIEINGMLYTTAGSRRAVVALDAKTGELKWVYSMNEGLRAAISPRQLSGRGVAFWTDGNGDDRIVYVTTGYRLVELNAHTGQPVEGFGEHGVVDLKIGAYTGVIGQPGVYKQIDLTTGEIGLHTVPTVAGNSIFVGSAMKEGSQPLEQNNTKGLTRAFDVKTGKLIWTFHNIPQKGEFGYDTWEKNSADFNGNTGTWTGITVDLKNKTAFLPIEDPTDDFYGGGRPGNDLFGDSLVAVDSDTGKMKWYFQVTHHPIWDYDLSSPALLVDVNVDGKAIEAVALPSKQGWLYTFDRNTGKPIWPIVEKPVDQTTVPDEKTAKTQPFPTKPANYVRTQVTANDIVDFTPEIHAKAMDIIKKYYKLGSMYNPPVVSNPKGLFPSGAIGNGTGGGGTNWPGGGFNPTTQVVFLPAAQSVSATGLVPLPEGLSNLKYDSGVGGQVFRINGGPGFGSASDAPKVSADDQKLAAALAAHPQVAVGPPPPRNVDGIPLGKPPYGTVTAINLNTGDFVWQVPNGPTPDEIRDNPLLKGVNLPPTGIGAQVGVAMNKTLVFQGDGGYVTQPGHPRGAYLRGRDQKTGQEIGAVYMPAPQSGSPMTYTTDGREFVVVAVSGGNYSGDYLAFALPQGN